MVDLLNQIVGQIGDLIPSWVPWVAGGSTVGLIVVAVLAPSVLSIAAQTLGPLLSSFVKGVSELTKALWAGFIDMTDNGRSLLFVAAVALMAYLWGYTHGIKAIAPQHPSNGVRERIVPLPTPRPLDWRGFLQD